MFIKKEISILGNNEAIIRDLTTKLLEQNYKINIFVEDINNYVPVKDTLQRISYFDIKSKFSIHKINKSDIIINTLFLPSPNNISKIKKNLKLFNNIVQDINKKIKIIDILPLINEDRIKSFYKNLVKHNKKSNSYFNKYISIHVPAVLSNQDSIIQDIEELYKISGKVIRYKENFSYVDKDDLNEAILTLLNSNIYKKACFEIGEYNSTNVDYINDSVIINSNELYSISFISHLYKSFLAFVYKKPLNSFSAKYLYFLKASKKASRKALNLETLKIEKHSLMCILNKYKDKKAPKIEREYEDYEINNNDMVN